MLFVRRTTGSGNWQSSTIGLTPTLMAFASRVIRVGILPRLSSKQVKVVKLSSPRSYRVKVATRNVFRQYLSSAAPLKIVFAV